MAESDDKMIERPLYLSKIEPYVGKDIVKVLTGIRRSGKSCLLKMLRDHLVQSGVKSTATIMANFESAVDLSVRSAEAMRARVSQVARENPGQKLYLFFDEVQELEGWEKLVNSLLIDFSVDIYITGSNSKLLSTELATYLGGRYVEVRVFPLSFAEAWPCLAQEGLEKRKAFLEYAKRGGMPFIYDTRLAPEAVRNYLGDLFNSIVLKDIARRHQVRDIDLLERILRYLMSETAHAFSPKNLVNYLKNEHRKVGLETLYNYVSFAEEACFVEAVKRFDLVGKEILSTQEKVFLEDVGFREALLGSNQQHIDRILENIVAVELMRRGWTVMVGSLKALEVDFVATKQNERLYVQVAYQMPTEETREREFRPLLEIKGDNFTRLVLSLDELDFSRDGIRHQSLVDWCSLQP